MADQTNSYSTAEPRRSSTGALAFVVGALVALVGVLAYVVFGGDASLGSGEPSSSIEITVPSGDAPAADAGASGGAAASGD